jgi:hypothetical protein
VGDGVLLAEILEQRRQRREVVPDCAAAEFAPQQVVGSSRQAMTCARGTVRNSSGLPMPANRMKS